LLLIKFEKEFATKEKLEIVIGAAEPRFAGLAPRRRRRRNSLELFLEYSTNYNLTNGYTPYSYKL